MSNRQMDERELSELLPLPTERFLILLSLADGARHGYDIMQDVARRTADEVRIQTGALYRHLKRLLDDGLIEEQAAPASSADERRRYYELTRLGRRVLTAETTRLKQLVRAARHSVRPNTRMA
jgi:DNA-binding PadR family transcriptional regulator